MPVPDDRRYSPEDLWVRVEADGAEAALGVTDFAQDQLGEVVYVELPAPGAGLRRGEPFGVAESVKAVVDLVAPVSGVVLERNPRLDESPETVNASPYGDGWLLRVRLTAPAEVDDLLSPQAYRLRARPE